jgi:hypothetical protein
MGDSSAVELGGRQCAASIISHHPEIRMKRIWIGDEVFVMKRLLVSVLQCVGV